MESAIYWIGTYAAVPGMRLRIDGEFPFSRYMSWNVYDPQVRPLDAIADFQIVPDAGSSNPFLPKAKRNAERRSYSVFVEFGPRPENPEDRAPNTLYTGTGQDGLPNLRGALAYRIYIPDAGRDETGGVGLPTVTLQPRDGGRAAASPCRDLAKPPVAGVNEQIAASDAEVPVGGVLGAPATPIPAWRKFVNLLYSTAPSETTRQYGGSGGLLSNVHNQYLSTTVSRQFGQVVVTRLRVPTFPDTREAPKRMPTGQVRFFSMCENHRGTSRFIACRADDQTRVDRKGFATYVMSTPAQRPAKATARCGATWLPWGPFREGVLIYRHMLPRSAFTQAIQFSTVEREAETMGDYYPVSRYYADAAAYDREVSCR